ncbi:MAG: DUF4162 domain-containing protein, partial [Muribaculaceae bacterium]|nr:DUF4162 domain-containing protein [Muribaculaceae bacterium]
NMSSVETLCDSFTLFNRSRNILSGRVDDVRREMGRNHYRLSFQGEPERLLQGLGERVAQSSVGAPRETSEGVIHDAEFTLRPDVRLHDFLATANDAVEIVTFDRALPSMNEIFIKAVEQANAPS